MAQRAPGRLRFGPSLAVVVDQIAAAGPASAGERMEIHALSQAVGAVQLQQLVARIGLDGLNLACLSGWHTQHLSLDTAHSLAFVTEQISAAVWPKIHLSERHARGMEKRYATDCRRLCIGSLQFPFFGHSVRQFVPR